MKISLKHILLALTLTVFATSAFAGREGRKLPVGAYIKSAKIEILSGDLERYKTAEALLDSLFMFYGPHAEGLHLVEQMMVDYIDKTPGTKEKMPYLAKLVAYNDSLHLCCESKDVKDKYKKGCDEYVTLSDSLKVKYWREFYNAGIQQKNDIEDIQANMANETDSSYLARYQEEIDAKVDSAVTNMDAALLLDPGNYMSYIGIGSVYEKIKDYNNALVYLKKGLDAIDDKENLLLNIAYDHIQIDQYLEAIPYFKQYVALKPDDVNNMFNLAICYNNVGFFDSALAVNREIIAIDSTHAEAYGNIGRFFNQRVREASDSITFYREKGENETSEKWAAARNEMYDSSLVYFKRVTELKPDDILALEQYGTIAALRGNFADAAQTFKKLTDLEPNNSLYWSYLGDCYISDKKFKEAAESYERVVQLKENDRDTWERLSSLYNELKMPDKKKEADAKVKSLQ